MKSPLSLVVVVVIFASSAAGSIVLERQNLVAAGQVLHVVSRDIDQDGVNELIAVTREGKPTSPVRALHIWKSGPNGFAPKATTRIALPSRTVAFDVCDVDDAVAGAEIVLITTRGLEAVNALTSTTTKPRMLASFAPAYGFPDVMDAPPVDVCHRPKGALGVEVWVPTHGGVRVFQRGTGTVNDVVTLGVTPLARHVIPDEFRGPRVRRDYSVLTEIAFPRLESRDFDNDGADDALATIEDRVWVFFRKDGVLEKKASVDVTLRLRTDDEWRADKNRLQVFFGDVTGDALIDVVAVKSTGSIADLATTTRFFAGKGRAGLEMAPFAERASSGYAIPEGVVDLDGDGVSEILEPRLDTSAMAVARLVVTGKINMEFRALRAKEKKIIDGDEMSLLFRFDPGGAGVKGTLPLYGADVDGDGISDRVDLGLGDTVEIFRGTKGQRSFDDDAAWKTEVISTRKAAWYQPNDAAPASIVIYFPQLKDEGDQIVVYWNRTSPRR